MTSPPSSETGATAEEEARITLAEAMLCVKAGNMVGAEARIEQHLVHYAAQAKRSAHLEDARAGCQRCRDQGDPVEIRKHGLRWWHPRHPDDWRIGELQCTRPEVWDALSLPPGGTK